MIRMKEFVRVSSIDEALKLNAVKNNAVIGGGLWLRLGERKIARGIDLSLLSLDRINETDKRFKIGAMVSLRQLETHRGLHNYFKGAFKNALKGIVGVQFRNSATLGGSVYSRFGFSDIIPLLLSVNAKVILNNTDETALKDYVLQKKDRNVITHIVIPKENPEIYYESLRKESADIPMLNAAIALYPDNSLYLIVGARPQLSALIETNLPNTENMESFIEEQVNHFSFSGNQRASKEYRAVLAKYLLSKGLKEVLSRRNKNGN